MFWIFLFIINILWYSLMWIDKIKSIYKKWRISEKMLFLVAICGGTFGIWLGMQAPLYHKAWKNIFKIFIPIISLFWILIIIYFLGKI